MFSNVIGLYSQKAQILNEFNLSAASIKGILPCNGYGFEDIREAFDMYPFTDGANFLGSGVIFSFYGWLPLICFFLWNTILPKTKVRNNVTRARLKSHMLSDNSNVCLKIADCLLFTSPNQQFLQWNLERKPANYNTMETIARTCIISSHRNLFNQENVFNNAPIWWIAVAMNTNLAVLLMKSFQISTITSLLSLYYLFWYSSELRLKKKREWMCLLPQWV